MHKKLIVAGGPLMVAALTLASAAQVEAALAHRYTFSGNLMDSIGNAHGTLVDPGAPTATFTNGQLDLSANNGNGSNNITEDAYVDLPNGLISTTANVNGALTLELWATISQQRTWQRLVDFGVSLNNEGVGGEDLSPGAQQANYFYISPNHGRFENGWATEVHQPDTAFEVGRTGPTPLNQQFHVVATYDHNDTAGGANPNGTTKLYIDGTLIGSVQIAPNVDLRTLNDVNNWIGRSQWPDPLFDGLVNEFRIYDTAVPEEEVFQHYIFGPDSLNPNGAVTLEVDRVSGLITLKNTATEPLNIDFLRIASAAGALNPTAWNSLDDQNFGATDGPDAGTVAGDALGEGWDEAGGASANELVEQFIKGSGSAIPAGAAISLGNAFNTSIFGVGNDGDLVFQLARNNGELLTSRVTYVGEGGGQPGDFDGDNDVDGNDFLVWQRGFGATHNATTLATWKANFGAAGAEASAAAIPEPTSLVLLLAAACLLSYRQGRA